MDVDSNSATPMRYGVRGIPTLLVFKGGQVKEQIVGYTSQGNDQKAIDKHVGKTVVSRQLATVQTPGLFPGVFFVRFESCG